jgi:hypothetical protein
MWWYGAEQSVSSASELAIGYVRQFRVSRAALSGADGALEV